MKTGRQEPLPARAVPDGYAAALHLTECWAQYIKAFNAWAGEDPLTSLRFTAREPAPAITKIT